LLSPVAIAGAAAGIAGTLMCHPLEVIKVCWTKLHVDSQNSKTVCSLVYSVLVMCLTFSMFYLWQDRLTVDRVAYPSISIAFSKIYRTEGIRGLYSGLAPTLIGMLPYSTCYYFMYDTIKTSYCRLHKKKSLSRPELLIIGALTGKTRFPPPVTSFIHHLSVSGWTYLIICCEFAKGVGISAQTNKLGLQ
jgi:solute carrier family 25 phosphate transporter 23/24/25/41